MMKKYQVLHTRDELGGQYESHPCTLATDTLGEAIEEFARLESQGAYILRAVDGATFHHECGWIGAEM